METYRNPRPSEMLLSFITSGQNYPQENLFSLLGTHKVGDTELRKLQRGDVVQGIENDTGNNIVGVLRFSTKVKAYRIRPYVIAAADPSGVSLNLGLAVYPRFFGDKTQGQGVAPTQVEDDARTAGTQGEISLTAGATAIDVFTDNPFTGNDWLEDFADVGTDEDSVSAGEALTIYPVTDASIDIGAFGRILSLEGFDTNNPDSGFILLDPAFNEYLVARMLDVSNTSTVRGIILVVDSDC